MKPSEPQNAGGGENLENGRHERSMTQFEGEKEIRHNFRDYFFAIHMDNNS